MGLERRSGASGASRRNEMPPPPPPSRAPHHHSTCQPRLLRPAHPPQGRGESHVLLDISHKPRAAVLDHFPNVAAHGASLGLDITQVDGAWLLGSLACWAHTAERRSRSS